MSTTQSPVVGELYARISERTGARAPMLRAFAEAYLRRMSGDALGGLSAEELFGEIVGAFDLADRRGADPFAVRAFNPTLASDGYALPGSVHETNAPDSPFLVDSVSADLEARGHEIREV
ncbi:MAG: glutamate dehydrogenase, partial [Gaiellaceae bacterium]|nr:glutamate dehydrogenase [Gaiellaceae bacterium]